MNLHQGFASELQELYESISIQLAVSDRLGKMDKLDVEEEKIKPPMNTTSSVNNVATFPHGL